MSSYCRIIILGRLTRDPEVRTSQGGMEIVKFGLAVNERRKNAQGEWVEEPSFLDVVSFGKRGEAFARFHKRGSLAFIEGSLRSSSWEDKDTGKKRTKLEVVLSEWQFVGGDKPSGGQSRQSDPYAAQHDAAMAGDDDGAPF